MHVFSKNGGELDEILSCLRLIPQSIEIFFFLSVAHERETLMDGIDDKLTRFLTSYY